MQAAKRKVTTAGLPTQRGLRHALIRNSGDRFHSTRTHKAAVDICIQDI
jgi:hypothetical protein